MNTNLNKEKLLFPDQLNITINTSIPGFKKIKFNSSMLNKGSSGKKIMFNPLIKLNERTISKIPQEYRIKDFFDKDSFKMLLDKMKQKPASSLLQATRQGYVDNNIKITLDTLFPVNSVIYIANNPYSIADIQWTTGDWKIETKKSDNLPKTYTQLVKEEIISGQKQLKQIPQGVIFGNNYSGPLPGLASGVKGPTTDSNLSTPSQSITSIPSTVTNTSSRKNLTTLTQDSGPTFKPINSSVASSSQGQETMNLDQPSVRSDYFQLPSDIGNQVLSPQDEQLFEVFKNNLSENVNETKFLFNYFTKKDFFTLVQYICFNLTTSVRDNINNFYSLITNMKPKNQSKLLDQKLYNTACQNISVISAPSDGDCFFKAVSDGINIYNYENQTKKIIFNNYGNTQLFTVAVLRDIVYRYINSLGEDKIDNMLTIAGIDINELNERFEEAVNSIKTTHNGNITQDEYLAELNNVYKMFDNNFLVYKPSSVPINIDEYDKPFRVLKPNEIEAYIKSKDYWANSIAIEAMCSILNICIVPIKKYDTVLGVSNDNILKSLFTNTDLIKSSCSQKIMFLLHHSNHYELIKFNYLIKTISTTKIGKWYTIFEDKNLIPPLNILLLIFGSAYINFDAESRKQFSIYQTILENMETSVVKIFNNCFNDNRQDLENFNNIFNKYFPNTRTITENLGINDIFGNCNTSTNLNSNSVAKIGGALNDKPPYGYYGYSPQYGYPPRYNYPPQYGYPPRYNYPPRHGYKPYYTNKAPEENQLAYAITIDMELYPGKSLSEEQLKNSKCNSKYNAIRKAFSEFTGRPYKIPSPYNKTAKNVNQQKNVLQPVLSGGNKKTRKNKKQ
jgi:hypothetical protein